MGLSADVGGNLGYQGPTRDRSAEAPAQGWGYFSSGSLSRIICAAAESISSPQALRSA